MAALFAFLLAGARPWLTAPVASSHKTLFSSSVWTELDGISIDDSEGKNRFPMYWYGAAVTSCVLCLALATGLSPRRRENESGKRSRSGIAAYLRKHLKSWEYMISGPDVIQTGYDKSNGKPYEVVTPDTRLVFVSSPEQIDELNKVPDSILSLQAAANKMLQPRYTMHGFSWFDQRGTEGIGFERALRTLLTNHLPFIIPELGRVVRIHFSELQQQQPLVNGERQTRVYPMMKKLVVLANAYSFLGDELYKNEAFRAAALTFVDQTIYGAEFMRILPNALKPIAGAIMERYFHCDQKVFDALLPHVEQRLQERDMRKKGSDIPVRNDCIEWIIETSPKKNPWSAQRVVWEILAIWFGSVHSLSITASNAIFNLCQHPEYVAPLRAELDSDYADFLGTGDGLPLLDSFLKESARLSPVETMSTRRAALKPYTFSDGTQLGEGDWAVTPVFAIMRDSRHYPNPLEFSGFRFVDPAILEKTFIPLDAQGSMQPEPSNFDTLDHTYKIWGTGRMACMNSPGRVYASAALKVIIGEIIIKYKCKLLDPEARTYMTWRSTMLPKSSTTVVFST
ncbi:unnamed protein product [Clonostachys rosea]|uniref:Cytochrome P450 n=1 Tax=Bionectria ochroleuca TaxID=29856 RepID=A0ABY6TV24_BIOOC|nr:unnamed protein product [Clonostachys rosea]